MIGRQGGTANPWIGRLAIVAIAAAAQPAGAAVAQVSPDFLIARAREAFGSGRSDEAIARLDSLGRASHARGAPATELAARVVRAQMLELVRRPREAEEDARVAARLATVLGDGVRLRRATRWRAAALGDLGRAAECAAEWKRLLELSSAGRDGEHEGYARLGLAYLARLAGRDSEALAGYEAAARLFHDARNPYWEAWSLTGLGHLHQSRGEFGPARRTHRRVAEVSRDGGVMEYRIHAANNLGSIEYFVGDPGRALEYFSEARRLGDSSPHRDAAINAAANVALMLDQLGRQAEALALVDTILAEARARGLPDLEANALLIRGEALRNQGHYSRSAATLRAAVRSGSAMSPDRRMEAALALAGVLSALDSAEAGARIVGEIAARMGSAPGPGTRALAARTLGDWDLRRGDPVRALERLRDAERLAGAAGQPRLAIAALALEGRACRMLGRYGEAHALLDRATVLWEAERMSAVQPEWRERFAIHARDLHAESARLILEDRRPGAGHERARRAFDAVQRFRARTLSERMRGPEGAAPPALEVATAAALQAALAAGELFFEPVSGGDATTLFAITRDSVRAALIRVPADSLARRIELFRQLASRVPDGAGGHDPSLALTEAAFGRLLFGPFAAEIRRAKRVIFSPDGALCRLPIGSLRLSERDEPLLASAEVVTVPSASVLLGVRGRGAKPRGGSEILLAWAGPSSAGGILPGAREEVRWLLGRYREAATIGRDAVPSLAVLGDRRPAIFHFAGHTEADDRNPWRSGLLLGGTGGDRYLRAMSVASARLPCRLVVLSSCATAAGAALTGEGVLGLGAAFLASGTPTLIASQWPVGDRTTVKLMRVFYRELAAGATAAAALRRAQLQLRADPRRRHPAYWAGFVLIGEPETRARLTARPPRLAYAWIAAASIGLAWFLLRRRSRRRV